MFGVSGELITYVCRNSRKICEHCIKINQKTEGFFKGCCNLVSASRQKVLTVWSLSLCNGGSQRQPDRSLFGFSLSRLQFVKILIEMKMKQNVFRVYTLASTSFYSFFFPPSFNLFCTKFPDQTTQQKTTENACRAFAVSRQSHGCIRHRDRQRGRSSRPETTGRLEGGVEMGLFKPTTRQ